MSQDTETSSPAVNRRRILQGLGIAGTAGVAGCFGDGGDGQDGDDGGDGEDGGDDTPADEGISFPLEVQLETNADNDDRVQMVELIAESMEQTGYFDVTVETFEWNSYVGRILDPEYGERGVLGCVGLSGTFNPHSYCDALYHSSNIGQCCNLAGVNVPELDEMIDGARYGADVANDAQLRRERYDEIWRELTDLTAYGFTHFGLQTNTASTQVIGMDAWPFHEGYLSYALYGPTDEQVIWLDRDGEQDHANPDLANLNEGGTLRVGVGANVDSFDPPYSNDTTSSLAQSVIYEGLTTSDKQGNIYPWLAEDWELQDQNDVGAADYADYMVSVEAGEEGAVPLERQIIVRHPDDFPAEKGDEVRVLTVDEAGDAVDDGTFGMHFRYDLREGVTFHNGEEFTADNVIATFNRLEGSQLSAQTFDSVLHVRKIDDYTVDIYAQEIDASAERELPGTALVIPTEHEDVEGGNLDPRQGTTPIGTGPYEFEEFEDAQFLRVTKNEDYWVEQMGVEEFDWFDGSSEFPDGPVIDELDMQIVPDDATRSGALQNDELDVTTGLNADTLDDFDASEDFYVSGVETGGYTFVAVPLNVEPWDDKRLRQAFNHLVPRERIVENVLAGWAREAWTPVPELAQGLGTTDAEALTEDLKPQNEFAPQQATELIEEVIEENGYESNV